jgi:DNA-binding Xre family transcriptional regulator
MYRNDLIRSAIVNKDLNKSTFAAESGLALNVVLKLWDGEVDIKLPSLMKACEHLGIPLHKVFEPKEEEASVAS